MKTILISAAVAAVAISFAGIRSLVPSANAASTPPVVNAVPVDAPAPALVTPPTQLGFADAVLCVGDCKKGDSKCVAECENVMTGGAALYHALMTCAEQHACEGDGLCARKNCDAQLNACLGAGAPEGGCK